MDYFKFNNIHHECVPKKVKDLLSANKYEEAILASVNFYQGYDMGESLKLTLLAFSNDMSIDTVTRETILETLFDIVLLTPVTQNHEIEIINKTNLLCVLAIEAEKISQETALKYYRHAYASLFLLSTIKRVKEDELLSIIKGIFNGLRRMKYYSKKTDSIIDPIFNSMIECLKIWADIPKGKGILLSRKPFLIGEDD